jgi:hypothetical protein
MTKLTRFLFLCLVCVFSSLSVATDKKVSDIMTEPDYVVEQFYKKYLTTFTNENVIISIADSQSVVDEYTSKNLQNKKNNDDSGGDYFIAAQDICPDWINHITTENISVKKNTATIRLTLGTREYPSSYLVQVVKYNNEWKLESVKFVSRSGEKCGQ